MGLLQQLSFNRELYKNECLSTTLLSPLQFCLKCLNIFLKNGCYLLASTWKCWSRTENLNKYNLCNFIVFFERIILCLCLLNISNVTFFFLWPLPFFWSIRMSPSVVLWKDLKKKNITFSSKFVLNLFFPNNTNKISIFQFLCRYKCLRRCEKVYPPDPAVLASHHRYDGASTLRHAHLQCTRWDIGARVILQSLIPIMDIRNQFLDLYIMYNVQCKP